jgi:hypothetical protein
MATDSRVAEKDRLRDSDGRGSGKVDADDISRRVTLVA